MGSSKSNAPASGRRITLASLRKAKQEGRRFASLTAYDASFAVLENAAGIELILVGDSLGMVVQGHRSTIPVTMDDVVYHTRLVARGAGRALVMGDMPFMSFATVDDARRNAARLMQEGGAEIVKLEGTGAQAETVEALSAQGVPVCAHLGLRPQAVHKLGAYKIQGREPDGAQELMDDAAALAEAGADMLLLECVPASLAKKITEHSPVPVIGIGAGVHCDGQILVLYDMLGITPGRRPSFSKDFLAEAGSIPAALEAYVEAVKSGTFPGPEHTFE
ncbi:MAG: 3-methyl-2-oxobutanoate hydroxymethyltransferase [Gammaproteobacteria bacterium]|nr:3-methyl-2-oxobutanoate hydroxymethyltransferase [Gammaproteobacteria bacterium]MDH3412852.1 3-methyl-2-oxobutanoate hydroxymethyltransferase [Gammaproteobacteria bacterium]